MGDHGPAVTMTRMPLAARVLERKDELEDAYADLGPHDDFERHTIATALAAVNELVTGDLGHPSDVVAHALARWLERTKHVGVDTARQARRRSAITRRR
jgi:hypothetical protein